MKSNSKQVFISFSSLEEKCGKPAPKWCINKDFGPTNENVVKAWALYVNWDSSDSQYPDIGQMM